MAVGFESELRFTIEDLAHETGYTRPTLVSLIKDLDACGALRKTHEYRQGLPGRKARVFTESERETILGVIYAVAEAIAKEITIQSLVEDTAASERQLRELVAELVSMELIDEPERSPYNKKRVIYSPRTKRVVVEVVSAVAEIIRTQKTLEAIAIATGKTMPTVLRYVKHLDSLGVLGDYRLGLSVKGPKPRVFDEDTFEFLVKIISMSDKLPRQNRLTAASNRPIASTPSVEPLRGLSRQRSRSLS